MPKVDEEIVIVGIGETTIGKFPELGPLHFQGLALYAALDDCGLSIRDIDGLVTLDPYATPHTMFSFTVAEYLGLKVKWSSVVDVGGTVSSLAMLQQAVWAISSGHCEMAAVVFGENASTVRPAGTHGFMVHSLDGDEEWEEPYAIQGAVIPYAMVTERFRYETGATDQDFGEVALVSRRHAMLNDNAMMKHKPMTMDDYLASRVISSPLRLFDCSIPADGGGAFILTTRDRARRMNRPAIGIKSMAMRTTHDGVVNLPDIADFGLREVGEDVFNSAGLGPESINVALLHDAFTVSVLLNLETLGFAKSGEGGAYMRSGAASLGGKCPLNPHGGLLSQGHCGGILHPIEAVRQLRHEAGRRQVEDARFAIVAGNGGIFSGCGAMIFGRD